MAEELKPLRIGELVVRPPVVLAALAGYTDLAYRTVCRELGAPFCSTEMMLDRQLLLPGKLRRRLVRIGQDDHPIAGQIIGSDPGTMAAAAAELCRSGFDVIDVNLACPARKVLRRRRGGYLLRVPELALRIIQAVVAAADRPVTVKLRTGFDAAGGETAFWRIAEGAFEAGVAALCVHARTVEQRYTGRADWGFLARVKAHFATGCIIGSGDVDGPAKVVEMVRRTGADGVAIARAAIGNPWIFRQLEDYLAGRPPRRPDLAEQRRVLERHYALTVQLYGPRRGSNRMRKFGIKYAKLHPAPKKVRAAFVNVTHPGQWQRVLETFYDG